MKNIFLILVFILLKCVPIHGYACCGIDDDSSSSGFGSGSPGSWLGGSGTSVYTSPSSYFGSRTDRYKSRYQPGSPGSYFGSYNPPGYSTPGSSYGIPGIGGLNNYRDDWGYPGGYSGRNATSARTYDRFGTSGHSSASWYDRSDYEYKSRYQPDSPGKYMGGSSKSSPSTFYGIPGTGGSNAGSYNAGDGRADSAYDSDSPGRYMGGSGELPTSTDRYGSSGQILPSEDYSDKPTTDSHSNPGYSKPSNKYVPGNTILDYSAAKSTKKDVPGIVVREGWKPAGDLLGYAESKLPDSSYQAPGSVVPGKYYSDERFTDGDISSANSKSANTSAFYKSDTPGIVDRQGWNTASDLLGYANYKSSSDGSVLGERNDSQTTTATNRTAGSIRNVNPKRGTQNCVNCSIATDATLAGKPASALPGSPTSIRTLEEQFGGSFGPAVSHSGIERQMLNAGNGSRGIVFGSRGSQTGHVFNVVNQKGTIRFLDGQTGKPASFDGFQSLYLLRTN